MAGSIQIIFVVGCNHNQYWDKVENRMSVDSVCLSVEDYMAEVHKILNFYEELKENKIFWCIPFFLSATIMKFIVD